MNSDSRSGVLAVLAALGGIALAPLTGCNSMTDDLGSWVGHPASEMEEFLGRAVMKKDIGYGRQEWGWNGYRPMPHGFSWACNMTAYVDRNGIVYRTNHSDCPADTRSPKAAGR